jgi:mannose-6-phosphate isomerase-like protein (cupin superfamily)
MEVQSARLRCSCRIAQQCDLTPTIAVDADHFSELTQLQLKLYLSSELRQGDSMQTAKRKWIVATCLCAIPMLGVAHAQQVDHYTPGSLLEQAKPLQQKAGTSTGSASETLQKYGVDFTMLSFRSKDGLPELHEKFADIFVVVDGSATLLSGGELADPTSIGPGEMHGTAIRHSTTTALAKGDIVHIPANTPHQLLIPKDRTFTYFVVKVREKD